MNLVTLLFKLHEQWATCYSDYYHPDQYSSNTSNPFQDRSRAAAIVWLIASIITFYVCFIVVLAIVIGLNFGPWACVGFLLFNIAYVLYGCAKRVYDTRPIVDKGSNPSNIKAAT